MDIFQQIDPPRKQARARINKQAIWYSWSNEFRYLLKHLSRQFRSLKEPASRHLLGGKEYDDTYTLDINSISDKALTRELMRFSKCLYNLDISDRLMLFTDMLNEDLYGRNLARLFASFEPHWSLFLMIHFRRCVNQSSIKKEETNFHCTPICMYR